MTRLRTSRPKRSVPNHACALGDDSIRSKFCSSGGYGARTPAKRAVTTISSANAPPRSTTVLRPTRRTCLPHGRRCPAGVACARRLGCGSVGVNAEDGPTRGVQGGEQDPLARGEPLGLAIHARREAWTLVELQEADRV